MNPEEFEKGIEQALALYDEGKPLQVIFGLFPKQKETLEEMFGMVQWIESERDAIRPRPELLRETLDKLVFIDEARSVETGSEPLSFSSIQKILPRRKQKTGGAVHSGLAVFARSTLLKIKSLFNTKPRLAWGSLSGVCVALLLVMILPGSEPEPTDAGLATTAMIAVRNDEQAVPTNESFAKNSAPVTERLDVEVIEILRNSAKNEEKILNGAENDIDFLDPSTSLIQSIDTSINATFESNVCSNITATQTSYDKKVSSLKSAFQKSFEDRKVSLEEERDSRYEALKSERGARDTAFQEELARLRDKAERTADKTSIQTFEELVATLQRERGKKIDSAMATYRAGIDASMKRRQATVADALLAFDTQVEKTFVSTAKSCKTDSALARTTLQNDIIASREILKKSIGTKDAMRPVLDSLENAREKAVQTANTEYETGLENSVHTLPLL